MQLGTFDGIVQAATTGQPITATSTCTYILIPVTNVHVVPPGKEIIIFIDEIILFVCVCVQYNCMYFTACTM